jgi:L-2,4-diaminobutyric acid acetyltransferase
LDIKLRVPQKDDAKKIYTLVKDTNVLDVNSEYLYLLQTTHFQNFCCVATMDDAIVGFVSGYLIPNNQETLFIWQVAVDSKVRGNGLAQKMIVEILQRTHLKDVNTIHTTISPTNSSSKRLFEKLSKQYGVSFSKETIFEINDFNNAHEDEVLYKIKLKKQKENIQ